MQRSSLHTLQHSFKMIWLSDKLVVPHHSQGHWCNHPVPILPIWQDQTSQWAFGTSDRAI